MNAQQSPSIQSYNPNALPRDIRVRGSKSAFPHYRTRIMKSMTPTLHNQSPNTEKHNTHPEKNEDTNAHHTTRTKNHTPINFYRKGATINKVWEIQRTNNSKKCIKHGKILERHKSLLKIRFPEVTGQEIIHKQSSQQKIKIPHHVNSLLTVSGGFSAPQAIQGSRHYYYNIILTNPRQRAAPPRLTPSTYCPVT